LLSTSVPSTSNNAAMALSVMGTCYPAD
jgi:hypothetical protein